MNNLCLVPFIGLPASGKTTTALELIKYCSNVNFIYISYDLFQSKLNLNAIDLRSGKYKEFREFMLNLIDRISAALRNDDSEYTNTNKLLMEHGLEWSIQSTPVTKHSIICILIDDNHYYRSMRYVIYQMAKSYGTGFFQIYFNSTLKNSIVRNLKRFTTDYVPEEALVKMNIRLEPPNIKNHWETCYCIVNIDDNKINFNEIYQMISQQTNNPEKLGQVPEISLNIPPSKIHQIDLYLRKLITQYLKTNTIHHPEELNQKRKHILADLRARIIEIPNNLDEIQEYFIFNK